MKTKATCFKVFLIAFVFALIGRTGNAQTFDCYIANDILVAPNIYQFDVYLSATSTDFNIRTVQVGLQFNSAFIATGATVTGAVMAGTTQLNSYNPGGPQWNAAFYCLSVPANTGGFCSGSPANSNSTLFSTTVGPLRVATYQITSSLPFTCATPNISMIRPSDPAPTLGIVKMAITAWSSSCLAVTISTGGTYTHHGANSLYSQVNNPAGSVDDGNPCTMDACSLGVVVNTPIDADDGNPCTTDACDPLTGVTNTPINTDDNDACTVDGCDPVTGVFHTPVNTDDGNACTADGCDPVTGVYHNPIDFSDANLCDIESCDPATGNISHTPVSVDDNDACTADACDPVTGNISHTPVNTDDGNACTTDACDPVTGVSHTPVNTDDGDACTVDACDPTTGISHTPVNTDDGNACTVDACHPVTGVSHTPVNPDDGNACTTDACDPSTGVSNTQINPDDGNACTTDACDPVTGVSNTPVNTDDGNPCTSDGCDPVSGVFHNPVSTDDGNPCTTDGCDPVTGVFNTPVDFTDQNLCDIESCDPATGNVVHTPVDFNDQNACTIDGCVPATGVFHTPVNPDDQNICTVDGCDPVTGVFNNPINPDDQNVCTTDGCDPVTGVFNTPVNTDDGNPCTTDGCHPVTGIFHTPINTDDQNVCTTDGCDPVTGVFHTPVNSDDNNPCTADGCDPVTGVFNNPIDFSDSNPCDVEVCDPSTGNISHNVINTDDNNPCTVDGCDPVTGVFNTPINTDDQNPCTVDGCDPVTGVFHTPINTDDQNVCTTDGCDPVTGVFHTPINTDDQNICTTDGCDPVTGVFNTPINTDDQNVCTVDGCDPITGVFHNPVIVSDDNLCTTDGCDPITGVTHTPVNTDDNNPCTNDGCDPLTGVFHTPVNVDDQNPCTFDDCDLLNGITHTSVINASATSTPAGCTTGGTASAFPDDTQLYSYAWSNGGTTQTISNVQAGSYNVTVTHIATGCTGTASTVVGSTGGGGGTAPGPISGPILVCKGQKNIVYCVEPVPGATSYQWTLPNGTTGSSTGPCITIKIKSNWNGSGQICVRTNSQCGLSSPSCLTLVRVNSKPATPGPITGPTTLCPLATGTYSIAPVPNATSYEWKTSGGLIITSGQGTTSIDVSAPAGFTHGYIKVRAINCKGKSSWSSLNISGASGVPVWDYDKSNDNQVYGICPGQSYRYELHFNSQITCYYWEAPQGSVIFENNGGNSGNPLQVNSWHDDVDITFPAGFTSGYVTVSTCGSGANCSSSSTISLFVTSALPAPGSISGSSNVCRGNSNVSYSISSVPGATSYTWSVTGGATIRSGQGTRNVRIRYTGATTSNVVLSVVATTSCSQSVASTKNINVNLNCRVSQTGEEVADVISNLNAFPNPTSGKATITFNADREAKYSIKIIDVLGNSVVHENISAVEGYNMKEINLESVAKGLYFVTLQTEDKEAETLRIIVE